MAMKRRSKREKAARKVGRFALTVILAAVVGAIAIGAAYSKNRSSPVSGPQNAGRNQFDAGDDGVASRNQQFEPRRGNGELLPSFELKELGDARYLSLSEIRGIPIVINFWASWCPSCASEMPEFEAVHREFSDQVEFVGVNLADSEDRALDLVSRTGVTYRLVSDADGSYYRAVRGLGMPLTLFVTADGHIAKKVSGEIDAAALRKLILAHLLEPLPRQ